MASELKATSLNRGSNLLIGHFRILLGKDEQNVHHHISHLVGLKELYFGTVSYTHLTLPTTRMV